MWLVISDVVCMCEEGVSEMDSALTLPMDPVPSKHDERPSGKPGCPY